MTDVARRLRDFGAAKFGTSRGWQKRFAAALKVSPPSMNQYLAGTMGVGLKRHPALRALGCNIDWLMTGKGSMYESEKIPLRRIKVITITNEGNPMQIHDQQPEYAYIPESLIEGEEPLAIKVPDDSMAGVVWKDDVVFVSPSGEAHDKDLCLVRVSGEGQFIRHVFLVGEWCTLLSTNTPPFTVKRESIASIQRVLCANVAGDHLKHQ